MPTRRQIIDQAIARGDVAELLQIASMPRCACKGPVDGEPYCKCVMNSKQVRNAVSYFALKRGRLVRLKNKRDGRKVKALKAVLK